MWAALLADIALVSAITLPIGAVNSNWWNFASKINGDFVEEIGWPELVQTAAQIRDSLPPEDRSRLGVLAGNYGEAGAVNLYGPQYGLPRAISGINSFWQRGYGDPPPETLIVIGLSREFVDEHFNSCRLVAHTWNRYGVKNEETRIIRIFSFVVVRVKPGRNSGRIFGITGRAVCNCVICNRVVERLFSALCLYLRISTTRNLHYAPGPVRGAPTFVRRTMPPRI